MIPSVTQILKDAGIAVVYESQAMVEGARRGRLVHAAAHLIGNGKSIDPAWTDRHPETAPYIAGIEAFLDKHQWTFTVQPETEVRADAERYCGHPDWIGILDGVPAIVDLKTGAFPAWAGLQLGGYLYALRSMGLDKGHQMIRVGLELPGNERFKLHYEFTDPRNLSEFVILARAWWVRAKYAGAGL